MLYPIMLPSRITTSDEGYFALVNGQGIFPQTYFGLGNGGESNFPLNDSDQASFGLVDFFPSVHNPVMAYQIKLYTIKSFHQLFSHLVIAR